MDLRAGLSEAPLRTHIWIPASETAPLDDGSLAEAFVGDRLTVGLHPLAEASGLVRVPDPEDADLQIVPARWSLLSPAAQAEVRARADSWRPGTAPLVVWSDGDFALDVPHEHVVVVQNASHRSRTRAPRVTVPIFFGDLQVVGFGAEPELRDTERPLVGFCGQVAAHAVVRARAVAVELAHRGARARGRAWGPAPEPLQSHLRLRRRTLAALDDHPGVDTRFVRRDRYGVGGGRDRATGRGFEARREFLENLAGTDYTVCVRGQGNFSVRLYEALCCGRIPVVLDTDCLLPWPDDPFWREVALVVPSADRAVLGDRLVDHHERLAADGGLGRAQGRARQFWRDRISRIGFVGHLAAALRPAVEAAGRAGRSG